ncbi:hypothetical protein ACFL6Y_08690, partial [Elusimicrobiota bacterium]
LLSSMIIPQSQVFAKTNNNTLLILNSQDIKVLNSVRHFIKHNGGKLTHSYPPNSGIGNIPSSLDPQLASKFGAVIFRSAVNPASLNIYGGSAVMAGRIWNRKYAGALLVAPSISQAQQDQVISGSKLSFHWNNIEGASHYRIQISPGPDFSSFIVNAVINNHKYNMPLALVNVGAYYWRVKALDLMSQSQGQTRESAWSNTATFQVRSSMKPAKAPPVDGQAELSAVVLPKTLELKGKLPVKWDAVLGATYYRVQIAQADSFDPTLTDEIIEKTYFKLTRTSLGFDKTYYLRIMAGNDSIISLWSNVCTLKIGQPEPPKGDAIRE